MHEKLHLARINTHGHKFEIVVDPDLAVEFNKGKVNDVKEVLKSEQVFHDAKKGDLASESLMQEAFETSDVLQVAKQILNKGEIQVSAEHRDSLRDQKKKQVVDLIHKYAVDPKTGAPHPITRIENALKEAKVHVDENKSAEDQLKDIMSKLMPIIPIKYEIKEIEIHLKPEHAARLYGNIKQMGKLNKEDWLTDGSWVGVLEIPGGLEPEIYEKINEATHGDVEMKVNSKR